MTSLGPNAPSARPPATSPWANRGALAVLAVVTIAAYWPMLGHSFWSDDFTLIHVNQDLGWGGFLRFLLFADYGEREWLYWRPGWAFLMWAMHGMFGMHPAPFMGLALAMHVACVLAVHTVARRVTGSVAVAAAAGMFFALHPAHVEAVVWVAAAFNVLPAALALIVATGCLWSFANGDRRRMLVLALALAGASLLWKEAAYGFPVVLLAAWLLDRRKGAWQQRDTACLAAFVGFSLLVVGHYLFRNNTPATAGSPDVMAKIFEASVAGFLHHLAPLPDDPTVVAVGAALLFGVLLVVCGPRGRFWIVATAMGTVPYVFLSSGGRFAYFFHAPLSVFLAWSLATWLRVEQARWRGALAFTLLLAALALSPLDLRETIAVFGRDGAKSERILSSMLRDGLVSEATLRVDVVPLCLNNGLGSALSLRLGRPVQVVTMHTVPRPPFLVHLDTSGVRLPPDTRVLRYDDAGDRYTATTYGEMLGDLHPVPMFGLSSRYRVVANEGAALDLLRSRQVAPDQEPLLFAEPPARVDATATGRVVEVRTNARDIGATVECTASMLLTVAFLAPFDFRQPGAGILIDGEPAKVVEANVLFHAVVVPAGRHEIRLQFGF